MRGIHQSSPHNGLWFNSSNPSDPSTCARSRLVQVIDYWPSGLGHTCQRNLNQKTTILAQANQYAIYPLQIKAISYLWKNGLQYIPRNMHTVFALLCFVVVIHWLIFPYPSGLLRWHCGNLTIAPVPAKQPWWIWINTPCEFMWIP